MTLRRCDSLPNRLRASSPIPADNFNNHTEHLPDSKTNPDFQNENVQDEDNNTRKSLNTDFKKIKNGCPAKNGSSPQEAIKGSFTNNFIPVFANNNRVVKKKITYDNKPSEVNARKVDKCSSFPLETGQSSLQQGSRRERRRTLLRRLLSWTTRECDCREQYIPKLRPGEVLCTCNALRARTDRLKEYCERGRSKSVGYEVAKEVTQFRRSASAGATVGAETAVALRARAALTLARRYYPEGGWGWTITVVGTLVQMITHGLQLGGGPGAIACTASVKYKVSPLYTHGMYKCM